MCGIVGYFGPEVPNLCQLNAALNSVLHRGPDGEGIYVDQSSNYKVALGHRRLAVIDPDARSNQPFCFDDSILIFNGAIYNFIELRRELELLGHSFSTEGDTEVLAHALREWGKDALTRFEGMWAFAWYDKRKKLLLLSRDRFGEKPLYIWKRKEGLYFASEVKALAALVGEWPKVNYNHLSRYLVNGYKALHKTFETFYVDIESLPPASFLGCTPNKYEEAQSYWLPRPDIDYSMSYRDAVVSTRDNLTRAMGRCLRADVPVAFCMSGGVDSNSLISIAKKLYGCDVHGFSIMNSDPRYDEKELIDIAVDELAIQHTPVYLQSDRFLENLDLMVAQHDAPVSTISYFVHWQLMQTVSAEGYKVTISGTGADELFTGYYDHHNLYLYEASKNNENYESALLAWKTHQSKIVRNRYLQDPEIFIKDPNFRKHIYPHNDVFSSFLKTPWQEEFTEVDYGAGILRNRMMNELCQEVVPVILLEDDLNAMTFSIENRSPFLDCNVFRAASSIPSTYLIQDGIAKSVLRDAMRGLVPEPVLRNRRKVGFNAPILDLLDTRDPQVREAILEDGPIYELVDRKKIEELINMTNMANSYSKYLFSFLNAKSFLELRNGT